MKISFIGAGHVATNLGKLFSEAGHTVVYGTRNPLEFQTTIKNAAEQGDVVLLAIPYTAKNELIDKLKTVLDGKIVVDLTNPLNDDWSPLSLGAQNSSGEETFNILPGSKVVKAFSTIFASVMDINKQVFNGNKLTAFICGNDKESNKIVAELANDAGFIPVITGDIKNARYIEAIAHLNIAIALGQHKGTDAGFRYFSR